jgi:UPF0271 protein
MDLNADLGEGFGIWRLGDDDALLDVVTSANVACGFHAGDASTMRRVCQAAVARGVVIGAQVGYRDLAGFGRRRVDYDPADLCDDLLYQIGALEGIARVSGGRVGYVKPHGALYNVAAIDAVQAGAVVLAVVSYDLSLPLMCQPGSVLWHLASEAGLRVIAEGFADRAYQTDGRLVPRRSTGSILTDEAEVCARAVMLATEGMVLAVDGSLVSLPVSSICLHGDTPGAAALAGAVRAALLDAGVEVAPFVQPAPLG